MRARLVMLATVVMVLAGACGADERVAESPSGIEFDIDAELVVDDNGFTPERLEVTVGDTVELRNDGDDVHRLTSDTVDSGLVEPGETVLLRFDEVAVIDYHDAEAPDHHGTVVVASAP